MTFEKQFYKIKMQLFNTNHKYLTKKVVINSIPTSLEYIGTCKVFIEFNIDFIFDKEFTTFLAKKNLKILVDFLIFLQLLINNLHFIQTLFSLCSKRPVEPDPSERFRPRQPPRFGLFAPGRNQQVLPEQ
jgi:hypothetical protein